MQLTSKITQMGVIIWQCVALMISWACKLDKHISSEGEEVPHSPSYNPSVDGRVSPTHTPVFATHTPETGPARRQSSYWRSVADDDNDDYFLLGLGNL